MSTTAIGLAPAKGAGTRDIGFAVAIVCMLVLLFLPLPAILIDLGLAISISLSVLILMVALWIQRPLDFSAFPTVLLIATMLRLSLNVATTRLILTNGNEGYTAAGHVVAGFAKFVMGGDFVIGTIVFLILIIVNFLVITKGATRIAEVGARFALDAVPGKQMAIDADLTSGLIDERTAQQRRRDLEEESSFYGAMDGASKFVRGDAIAGMIITAVNVVGGVVIGVFRYDMSPARAADVFVKLSVGDGLVSQIPALVVSLAAGLLVTKGGTRGSADKAVLDQLGRYPRALMVAAGVVGVLALAPGLPILPFALLSGLLLLFSNVAARGIAEQVAGSHGQLRAPDPAGVQDGRQPLQQSMKTAEIEVCLGKQVSASLIASHDELAQRVAKMRRKFALQYGFVIPEIRVADDLYLPSKSYQIKIHGTVVAQHELRLGELLVITGDGRKPDVPGEETREPAFGMKAYWISAAFAQNVRRDGFTTIDPMSVLLTHLSEIIRNNLSQLLSYRDMRHLLERLEPEYKRLLEEIVPAHMSYSGLQAVLKLLLSERISIRNLHILLEAIAEIAPHARRAEQIAEHARFRIASQICGDNAESGVLKVLRLGSRWELAIHGAMKRDGKGDVIEFDFDPKLVEQFSREASTAINTLLEQGHRFVLVVAPDARPYVRMIIERTFSTLPVLSQLEIARTVQVQVLGSIS